MVGSSKPPAHLDVPPSGVEDIFCIFGVKFMTSAFFATSALCWRRKFPGLTGNGVKNISKHLVLEKFPHFSEVLWQSSQSSKNLV